MSGAAAAVLQLGGNRHGNKNQCAKDDGTGVREASGSLMLPTST